MTDIWRNKTTDQIKHRLKMYFCMWLFLSILHYMNWLWSSASSVEASARTCSKFIIASIMEAVTTDHACVFTWCLRNWCLYYKAVELYLKCTSYMYVTFNRGESLEHSTAIQSNSRQVIAEFPIMLNLKSLFALTADPALQGVVQKHVFGKLSNHSNKTCAEENDSKH